MKILLLEDDHLDAELIEETLKSEGIDCNITKVSTRMQYEHALQTDRFDLILSDYLLPSFDGLSALKIAKSIYSDIPFIIVSGRLGEETAIDVLKSGATDYVLKQKLERLASSVQRAMREVEEKIRRRELEAALQKAYQELEQRVEIRTAELALANDALRKEISDRKAIELQYLRAQRLESIGTLAGGIAHDLNNILTPILLSVQLLKSKLKDGEDRHLLSIISENAERGSHMVNQVLSFARGITGNRITVQLKHLILDLVKTLNSTFPKSIKIQMYVPNNLLPVLGDATQLYQVLINLAVNSRDAMPEGGLLTITAENCILDEKHKLLNIDAKPGHYILISIYDTGTGILPEVKDMIFDPFFTTKELGKGTGLGLSTALGIVRNHGGFINVFSVPNKESKVNIYLPVDENFYNTIPVGSTPDILSARNELILIVDDEISIREIVQKTLEAYGYRTLVASDGAEAIEVYKKHKDEINIVLTDIMMPVLDGSSVIRAIVNINPNVKIIASSGNPIANTLNEEVRKLVKSFLPKPYSVDVLLRTISEINL